MPAPCFQIWNSATGALTAPPTLQPTAATISVRTMLQIAAGANAALRPIEWGYVLNAVPAAPVDLELIDTGAVPATALTAHVAAGIHKVNYGGAGQASQVQLGTGLTGFAAAAPTEGAITATRLMDYHRENGLYLNKQYPLGREWELPAGNFLRVRATPSSAATVNIAVYVTYEE
jgi:hypothetical protein